MRWPGRMEEIFPGVYVDGAHNVGAIEAFARSIEREKEDTHLVILFSAVRDKNYEKMAEYLCKEVQADAYMITKIQDARGEGVEELARVFRTYTQAEVLAEEDLGQALKVAMEKKGQDGKLYCLGSLYLVGMIEELTGRHERC